MLCALLDLGRAISALQPREEARHGSGGWAWECLDALHSSRSFRNIAGPAKRSEVADAPSRVRAWVLRERQSGGSSKTAEVVVVRSKSKRRGEVGSDQMWIGRFIGGAVVVQIQG